MRELTTNGFDQWYGQNEGDRGWESEGDETLRLGSEAANSVGGLVHVIQDIDGISVETLSGLRGFYTTDAPYEQWHAKIRFKTADVVA